MNLIKNKEVYETALAMINRLVLKDPEPETIDYLMLSSLSSLVEEYEKENYTFEKMSERERAIFRLEQSEKTWKEGLLDSKNKAVKACHDHCNLCGYCTAEGPFEYECDDCMFKPFRPW